MKLKNRILGEIEYSENNVVYFPRGIVGFENVKEFIFIDLNNSYPFLWMISTQRDDLNFIVIDPRLIYPDYSVYIPPSVKRELRIESDDQIVFYVIVTLGENPEDMTVNLKAPIVVNKNYNMADQIIVYDEKLSIEAPILR